MDRPGPSHLGAREVRRSGSSHPDIILWKEAVKRSFPRLSEQSYVVPSVHMNETRFHAQNRPRGPIDVAEAPDKSATQDDLAQQHVLHCFEYLSDSQVMFVLSKFDFRDYLKKMPMYKQKSGKNLPKASDPQLQENDMGKGDFDILVIHRHFGVLAAEIKSKGFQYDSQDWNDMQKLAVVEKILDAIDQMSKFREVLDHILPDLGPDNLRTISLILPYVSRDQLRDILASNEGLKQKLCEVLGTQPDQDPSQYCLLADDVSDKMQPWKMTSRSDAKALNQWWHRVMSEGRDASTMTQDRYEDLVARFCGPATEVSLRTLGEGVSRVGDEFMRVCLTAEQVDILDEKDLTFLWLVGPPGTGKTLVLIQKALDWLQEGLDVHIVSFYAAAMAVAELIRVELTRDGHVVRVHHVSAEGEMAVIGALASASQETKIAVVIDEAKVFSFLNKVFSSQEEVPNSEPFISRMLSRVPGIAKLWAASCVPFDESYFPVDNSNMDERRLNKPLRTPPAITREVVQSIEFKLPYSKFSLGELPPPSDGGRVIALCHLSGNDGGHHGHNPAECRQCGKELGELLRTELGIVGRQESASPPTKKKKNLEARPLRYADVFILAHQPNDNAAAWIVISQAFGHALEKAGFPFMVVKRGDQRTIAQIVQQHEARPDKVVVSDFHTVKGLERKVVVWLDNSLPGIRRDSTENIARLHGMSRCVSQLVCVTVPKVAKSSEWKVWQPTSGSG